MSDQNNPFNVGSFREELGEMFDAKLQPITTLLDKHDKAIDDHTAALNRAYGGIGAFVFIQSAALAIWEYFFHHK